MALLLLIGLAVGMDDGVEEPKTTSCATWHAGLRRGRHDGYIEYDRGEHNWGEMVEDGLRQGGLSWDGGLEQLHTVLGTGQLEEHHEAFYDDVPIFGKTDRQSDFITRFYRMYDSDEAWERLYLRLIREVVRPRLFPNETALIVQHTPNLRVHVPGNSNIGRRPGDPSSEVIGLHRDREFGHRHDEVNVVVPLTSMQGTNSIFYEPFPDSGLPPEQYSTVTTEPGRLFFANLNACHHYNRVNTEGTTRVSLDFRVVPASSFARDQHGGQGAAATSATSRKKFRLGDYYREVSCDDDGEQQQRQQQ